ncbi:MULTISPECIES: prolyl aminopeptidase [Rhodococcus]|uniref:prolyl aminopeptidase n=1 Tax=Rhodococcus globerulus TaxID=33008 RepID=UPI001C58EE86|nr:prolyl aminopeptidase [Rhodococcus globerulus]QXW00322.1 prolyl aminopeptidase [Rhodococcus globerulus]
MSAYLFPPVDPYESGMLDTSDGQTLYWESVGISTGVPVLYLHGGPGSGCTLGARRFFDPDIFRAVLFDQRGCGRSRPLADGPDVDLTVNTTAHILDDIERLREYLGIERWIVTGLSWGVSLGLVYAQAFPERVIAMVLGAITGGTNTEIEWITRAMGRVFPREWEEFIEPVPMDERDGNLPAAYARLLADPNPVVQENAALQWCRWEDVHVSLMPGWTPSKRYENPDFRRVFTRLVTHFWSHDCFLVPNQIMDGMHRLAEIPAILVHGRYDVSGPLDTAWAIHKSWPGSELVVRGDAGHGGGGFNEAIVEALNAVGRSA